MPSGRLRIEHDKFGVKSPPSQSCGKLNSIWSSRNLQLCEVGGVFRDYLSHGCPPFVVLILFLSVLTNSSSYDAFDPHKCWYKWLVCYNFSNACWVSPQRLYRSQLMSDRGIDLPVASLDDEGDLIQVEQAATLSVSYFDEGLIYGGDGKGQSILQMAISKETR